MTAALRSLPTALRDSGMEVIYTDCAKLLNGGYGRAPGDVDAIGISILSGAIWLFFKDHYTHERKGLDDVFWPVAYYSGVYAGIK